MSANNKWFGKSKSVKRHEGKACEAVRVGKIFNITMKKIILVSIVFLLSVKAGAQDVQFGIKAGGNMALVVGDDITDPRYGIHVGGFLSKPLSNVLDLQLELLYSMKGGSSNEWDWTDKFDYINLPVMLKIYVNKERRKFSIDVGPQFGYLISAKNTGVFNYNDDAFNKFEVDLGLGVSYKIIDELDVTFRSTGGLTNIFKEGDSSKNRCIQLGIGYRF